MSIVEETRIALLEMFPEFAAADAAARAAADKIDDEMETMIDEMDSIEPATEGDAPAGGDDEVEAAEPAEAATEPVPEPEEPEEEGPRENGVMLTDHAARGTDIDVLCAPDQVVQAARIMDESGFFLEAITGVDWIKDDKLEVIYDYNQYGQEQCRVVVRTLIPRSEPEIPTISDVMPSANWHERETHDFYGIKFIGHPHLIPILLPEDADFHPLLKDFKP